MSVELSNNEITTLRILIKRFEKIDATRTNVINQIHATLGEHLSEKIHNQVVETVHHQMNSGEAEAYFEKLRDGEFTGAVQGYLDKLQDEAEQYEYEKLNLRPQYLDYMIGLGYTEKEVVTTYNDVMQENEELTDDSTTFEVITRDKLEKEKHGALK